MAAPVDLVDRALERDGPDGLPQFLKLHVESGVGEQAGAADMVVMKVGQDDGSDGQRIDAVPGQFEGQEIVGVAGAIVLGRLRAGSRAGIDQDGAAGPLEQPGSAGSVDAGVAAVGPV